MRLWGTSVICMQQNHGPQRNMITVGCWLLAFEMQRYSWILNLKVKDHVTKDEARNQVKWEWMVMDTIWKRKLQLFGHICRMSDDRLLKTLMLGMVESEKQPRWPARRWVDNVVMRRDKDIKGLTEQRDNWTRFVSIGEHLQFLWPQHSKKNKKHCSQGAVEGVSLDLNPKKLCLFCFLHHVGEFKLSTIFSRLNLKLLCQTPGYVTVHSSACLSTLDPPF